MAMDKGGSLRFLLLGLVGVVLFMTLGKWGSGGDGARQPLGRESHTVPAARAPEQTCHIWSPTLHAELRTHGATITHLQLLTSKYRRHGSAQDLSTTPDPQGDHEFRQTLFTHFRSDGPEDPKAPWNVAFDSVDYTLDKTDGKTCEFSYKDSNVELKKVVRATEHAYELEVSSTIKNLAASPMRHQASIDTVEWRTSHEVEGKMFRISPYITFVECMPDGGKAVRLRPQDFEPKEFKSEAFKATELNPNGDWHLGARTPAFAAVSNAYFSHAMVPAGGSPAPQCLLQIEQRWDSTRFDRASADPHGGAMYRARLAYPPATLEPNQSAEYRVFAYIGPKERDALAQAGGGRGLGELIDLGFFSSIAKVLVAFLLKVHSVIPNWGVAIIVLTITARTLLFPLSWPGIQNMVRMREIKPEMDVINEKFKDDPQGRGLAQMELWRKHKVNPFKGCLPQLASMPVWFALYTTLQTAVELYNIPFLWFPDLSESDPLFILPFIIGGTYFVQQKMMPMQGGDPVQQKMMMYFMPGMFTVFMLFLPAGLGVYMFTNSVLAITQQWLVERYAKKNVGKGRQGDIGVKVKGAPSGAPKRDGRSDKPPPSGKKLLDEGEQET
jgi:YidC/Oxa1 family membrane protein insertase